MHRVFGARRLLTIVIAVALGCSLLAPAFVGGVAASASQQATTAPVVAQVDDLECSFPVERTDARGETVELDEEPERIVTLYPSDAQVAFQIGIEDRVVGMPVGQYTDSLDVDDQTDISGDDDVTPIDEVIVDLEPDLVLAANVAAGEEDLLETLENEGIPVYVMETATSLEGVEENVAVTGELSGECAGAQETLDWMDERLGVLADAVDDEDAPLAYYVSDDQGTTAGTVTFQHDVLEAAGLENVAERADIEGWGEISPEVVVAEDPEWIVYPDWADEPQIPEGLESTTAVSEDNVVAVDDNAMNQPAPDVVFVIDSLVSTIYPDAYAAIEADLEAIDDEYGMDAPGDAGGDDADADGSSDDPADDDGSSAIETEDDGSSTSETEDDGSTASETDDGDDSEPIPAVGITGALLALVAVAAFAVGRRSD